MTLRCTSLLAALALAIGFPGAWAQTGAAPAASAAPPRATPAKPPAKAAPAANGKAPSTAGKPAPPNAAPNASPNAAPVAAAPASAPSTVVKPAASAPYKGKPATRPLSADEERESSMAPGELRPERTIVPQVTIPLGRKPPDTTHMTGKPGGSVNDAAGRCAALSDENERAICRERAGLGTAVRK